MLLNGQFFLGVKFFDDRITRSVVMPTVYGKASGACVVKRMAYLLIGPIILF